MSSTQEKLGSILDANDSKMASFSAIIWHKGEGRAAKREWQKRRQETIDDLTTLIDSAKREALKELPFTHDTMGFCEHFGKQFRPCAKCVVDERLAQLEQSKESE